MLFTAHLGNLFNGLCAAPDDGAALGRFNGGLSKAIRMYNRVEDTIGDIEDIDE